MNLVVLSGNLTQEPTLKYLDGAGGKVAVCNFCIAINRHYKSKGEKKKETTFVDCEVWDKGAETLVKYVRKGDPLLIRSGRLKKDTWEKDGQPRSKMMVRVEDFEMLYRSSGSKNVVDSDSDAMSDTDTNASSEASKPNPEVDSELVPSPQSNQDVPDGDDIPF
jgi:single-strand DNA-binding protein